MEPGSIPRRQELSLADFEAGVCRGDRAILARALTLIESNQPRDEEKAEQLLARLTPHTGGAIRVGITGVPGVGKSTFIEALGLYLVRQGLSVAVLAVDPSSSQTGGSILGDKTRMAKLAVEPAAFIRPSPAAGSLGGVARKTREALLICEAAGFQVVLVETVGVGQSETVVAEMTDCLLALLLPNAGDELQGLKRGLLEVVDVVAINKADGPARSAAEIAAQQVRNSLHTTSRPGGTPPVLRCSALSGEGIAEVWQAIVDRQARLTASGELTATRHRQNLSWLWSLVELRLRQWVARHPGIAAIRAEIESEVLAGRLTAEAAARRILAACGLPAADPQVFP